MSPRPDYSEDMRRLVAMIERRMSEYDARHRRRKRIDSTLSKTLSTTKNPGVFTLREIASSIETTVGDLLNEPLLGETDLQKLASFVDFVIDRFDLTGVRAAARRDERRFAVTEEEFVEREYDYPRPHHVFIVPHARAAAGEGIEGESSVETTEVLHSIRDVYTGNLRVIKVIGDSMAPVLRDGNKVAIDIRRTSPREGEVVAVYHHMAGGILGYWRVGNHGGEFWLDKANDAFNSVRLDAIRDWTLWGTATRIVDAPVPPRTP
ncbi:MAG TPA: S24 family peptidase [Thermoanaerobaculia bacterium]|nr:S24 family peptidase [Thermoanaerobaculia bacterium]